MTHDFKVGDKVIYDGYDNSELINEIGYIKHMRSITDDSPGVRYDKEFDNGHDLEGRCENKHGWYSDVHHLKLFKMNWKERCEGRS